MNLQAEKPYKAEMLGNLVSRTIDGYVIPVVGNCLINVIDRNNRKRSIEEYLAEKLKQELELSTQSTDFMSVCSLGNSIDADVHADLKRIYERIGKKGYFDTENDRLDISSIENLVKIKDFKLFLSFSFTDVLEKQLREMHGSDRVNVINVSLSKTSTIEISGQLKRKREYTVINLMGCITSGKEFSTTEEEILESVFLILSDDSCSSLRTFLFAETLQKTILYLKCNHMPWHTRYLIRGFTRKRYKEHRISDNIIVAKPSISFNDVTFLRDHKSTVLVNQSASHSMGYDLAEEFIKDLKSEYAKQTDPGKVLLGKVFISYNNHDKPHARQLNRILREKAKVRAWFDEEDLRSGPHVENIRKEIIGCSAFLVLLSEDTLENLSKANTEERTYFEEVELSLAKHQLIISQDNRDNKFMVFPCIIQPENEEQAIEQQDSRIPKWIRDLNIYNLRLNKGYYEGLDGILAEIRNHLLVQA